MRKKVFCFIDISTQILLLLAMLICWIQNNEEAFFWCLWILGFVQAISITCYCLLVKESFSPFRVVHYYGTVIVLSILLGLWILNLLNVKMDSSFTIELLILVAFCTAILGLLYLGITFDAYIQSRKRRKEKSLD